MIEVPKSALGRRQFIQGAACAIGAAALPVAAVVSAPLLTGFGMWVVDRISRDGRLLAPRQMALRDLPAAILEHGDILTLAWCDGEPA